MQMMRRRLLKRRRLLLRRFSDDVLMSTGRTLGDNPLRKLGREPVVVGQQLAVVDDDVTVAVDDNDVVVVADAAAKADVVVDDVGRLEVEVIVVRSFEAARK